MALLVQRQDELLLELKAAADEGFQRAKEWERTVTAWGNECFHAAWVLRETDVYPAEKKQEKSKADTASVEGSSAPRAASLPPGMMQRRRMSISA